MPNQPDQHAQLATHLQGLVVNLGTSEPFQKAVTPDVAMSEVVKFNDPRHLEGVHLVQAHDRTWRAAFALNGQLHVTSNINPGSRGRPPRTVVDGNSFANLVVSAANTYASRYERLLYVHGRTPVAHLRLVFDAAAYSDRFAVAHRTRNLWRGADWADIHERTRVLGLILANAWKHQVLRLEVAPDVSAELASTLVDAGSPFTVAGRRGGLCLGVRAGFVGSGAFGLLTGLRPASDVLGGEGTTTDAGALEAVDRAVCILNSRLDSFATEIDGVDVAGLPDPYAQPEVYACGRVASDGSRCLNPVYHQDGEPCAQHRRFDTSHPERPSVMYESRWDGRPEPEAGQWVHFERPFTRMGREVADWQRVQGSIFRAPGFAAQPLTGWQAGDFTITDTGPDLGLAGLDRDVHNQIIVSRGRLNTMLELGCEDPGCCAPLSCKVRDLGDGHVSVPEETYRRVMVNHVCTKHWDATKRVAEPVSRSPQTSRAGASAN